jgi:ABC-type nitrate/sulfonate/bicarbonate transport system substrate-binding protein
MNNIYNIVKNILSFLQQTRWGEMGFNGYKKIKCTSSSKRYRLKSICLLLILIIITFVACSKEDAKGPTGALEKISLGIPSSDYPLFFAFVLLAKEQGFFKDQALDVTYKYYPHGVGSLKALQKGEVDMAIGAEFPFVRQNLEGSRAKIFASIAQVDVLQLIARKDSGISKITDLKGKRVALILGSQLEFCLDRFLIRHGLRLNDIEILNLLPLGIEKSILEGRSDAVVFREPMIGRIKAGLEGNWVNWQVQDKRYVFWIVACAEIYVAQHPKAIKQFLQALRKAELFYLNNPQEAIDTIVRKGNLSADFVELMLPKIEYKLSLEKELLIAMEDETRWHIEKQYSDTKEVPNYLDRIYFDALEFVKPDAINIIH